MHTTLKGKLRRTIDALRKGADDYNERMKSMNVAAKAGDWDQALEHARAVPKSWSAFDQLPQHQIPPHAIDNVLAHVPRSDQGNFMFELGSNLHPDLTHEQLKNIGDRALDDHSVQKNLQEHPNWKPDLGAKAASDFWRSYERGVEPEHFATVKSMYTGQPESLVDHRGREGSSHGSWLSDGFVYRGEGQGPSEKGYKLSHDNVDQWQPKSSSLQLNAVIPHLQGHAKKVQDAILKDPYVQRRDFNGKTYIKLHRGVGGDYAKKILEAGEYDPEAHALSKKRLKVPVSGFSSWTTSKPMAGRFATTRNDLPNQEKGRGVIMSAWHPLDSVLHSGSHTIHVGQEHAHPSEEEIIVGHAKPNISLSTQGFEVQHSTEPAKDIPSGDFDAYQKAAVSSMVSRPKLRPALPKKA